MMAKDIERVNKWIEMVEGDGGSEYLKGLKRGTP